MQGVHDGNGTLDRQSVRTTPFTEAGEQVRFGHALEPALHQPGGDFYDVAVVHGCLLEPGVILLFSSRMASYPVIAGRPEVNLLFCKGGS
jgi:hypothetical protein